MLKYQYATDPASSRQLQARQQQTGSAKCWRYATDCRNSKPVHQTQPQTDTARSLQCARRRSSRQLHQQVQPTGSAKKVLIGRKRRGCASAEQRTTACSQGPRAWINAHRDFTALALRGVHIRKWVRPAVVIQTAPRAAGLRPLCQTDCFQTGKRGFTRRDVPRRMRFSVQRRSDAPHQHQHRRHFRQGVAWTSVHLFRPTTSQLEQTCSLMPIIPTQRFRSPRRTALPVSAACLARAATRLHRLSAASRSPFHLQLQKRKQQLAHIYALRCAIPLPNAWSLNTTTAIQTWQNACCTTLARHCCPHRAHRNCTDGLTGTHATKRRARQAENARRLAARPESVWLSATQQVLCAVMGSTKPSAIPVRTAALACRDLAKMASLRSPLKRRTTIGVRKSSALTSLNAAPTNSKQRLGQQTQIVPAARAINVSRGSTKRKRAMRLAVGNALPCNRNAVQTSTRHAILHRRPTACACRTQCASPTALNRPRQPPNRTVSAGGKRCQTCKTLSRLFLGRSKQTPTARHVCRGPAMQLQKSVPSIALNRSRRATPLPSPMYCRLAFTSWAVGCRLPAAVAEPEAIQILINSSSIRIQAAVLSEPTFSITAVHRTQRLTLPRTSFRRECTVKMESQPHLRRTACTALAMAAAGTACWLQQHRLLGRRSVSQWRWPSKAAAKGTCSRDQTAGTAAGTSAFTCNRTTEGWCFTTGSPARLPNIQHGSRASTLLTGLCTTLSCGSASLTLLWCLTAFRTTRTSRRRSMIAAAAERRR